MEQLDLAFIFSADGRPLWGTGALALFSRSRLSMSAPFTEQYRIDEFVSLGCAPLG